MSIPVTQTTHATTVRVIMVSCEITMAHTRKFRSAWLSALLLFIGALSLIFHFRIYQQTSASAFVNHPTFYYNRFYIRESNGQT